MVGVPTNQQGLHQPLVSPPNIIVITNHQHSKNITHRKLPIF